MRKIKLDNIIEANLYKKIKGQSINKIEYLENIPLEDNCVKIRFNDNSYLLVYALLRIVEKEQIILCSSDYYFNKNYIEYFNFASLTDTLIDTALHYVNKLIIGKSIKKVILNEYGDMILLIDGNIRIEIFFDVSEKDKDYYTYYGNEVCFSLCKLKKHIFMIEGPK